MPFIGYIISVFGLLVILTGAHLLARAYSKTGTVQAALDSVSLLKEEVSSVRRTLGDVQQALTTTRAHADRLVTVIRDLVELLDAHGVPVPPLPISLDRSSSS